MNFDYEVAVGDVFLTNGGCYCTVLEVNNKEDVIVEFLDTFKFRKKVSVYSLYSGNVKNPNRPSVWGKGYLGVGKFKVKEGGRFTIEYQVWQRMIGRCYNPKFLNKNESYRDCEVSENFLSFQNFAEWYTSHEFYGLGYEIDKDLLIRDNKLYSKDTCLLLPKRINNLFVNARGGDRSLPVGVYKTRGSRYCSRFCVDGKNLPLGTHDTPEEASAVYVKAKEDYIHSLAEKWHGKIEERAYQALMNWTVYP